MRIQELTLGDSFDNLHVEVYSLEGVDPASKPNDPAHIAIVRDPTGYATLVYRSSNKCQPSAVKKGKFFHISGERGARKGCKQQPGRAWKSCAHAAAPHHAASHAWAIMLPPAALCLSCQQRTQRAAAWTMHPWGLFLMLLLCILDAMQAG